MKRTPLRPISVKQAARNRALAKMKRELIEERGPWCEGPSFILRAMPEAIAERGVFHDVIACCQGRDVQLHHIVKRSRRHEDRKEDMALLCPICHLFTELHPDMATQVGLLRSAS